MDWSMHPAEESRRTRWWGRGSYLRIRPNVIEPDKKMPGSRSIELYRLPSVTGDLWPLVVRPARLLPASRAASDDGGTVHLYRETTSVAAEPGVPAVTLCGRPALSLGVDVDLDVLGLDRDRLCGSCWRIAEGCLEPPGAADGEDQVVAWLVETVLKGGSAMIDDVPFGRVRPLRQRVTRQIKATIGGRVTTALISPTTIVVYSGLVIDAKTEDQQHRELRDAMLRLWAGEAGLPLGQPDWRRSWSQVATTRGQ